MCVCEYCLYTVHLGGDLLYTHCTDRIHRAPGGYNSQVTDNQDREGVAPPRFAQGDKNCQLKKSKILIWQHENSGESLYVQIQYCH